MPPRGTQQLVVGSFNIHHGAGPGDELDLQHTADVIADMDADVLGLQEVDRHWSPRSGFMDQARWLEQRLGMHMAYGANQDHPPPQPGEPRRQYGTAILSRYPIRESRNTLLPRPGGGEQRGLLVAELLVGGVTVRFMTTHLQHSSRTDRLAQAEAINEVVEGAAGTVLVGDLNARPGTPEIHTLTRHLTDTWPVVGTADGFTYSARAPWARIDYILASPDIGIGQAEVLHAQASDHLPVIARLALPQGRIA